MPHTIRHEVRMYATPAVTYEALLDEAQFSAHTGGAPTSNGATEGGAFTCFGGYGTGHNIELLKHRRIVQAWRAKSWPQGVFFIAQFELQADGAGTLVVFDHTGYPEDGHEHLDQGWHENYWAPLMKALELQ